MTFGFSTLIDVLTWIAALSLGLKLVATVVLLSVRKDVRYRPGWGAGLWWATKITPVIAVPCVIWIALLQGWATIAWVYGALMLFVAIAVPIKIRRRRHHLMVTAEQVAAKPFDQP